MKGARAGLSPNEFVMPLFDTWMTFGDPSGPLDDSI